MLTIIYDLETTGFQGLPMFCDAHQILQICAYCIEYDKTYESFVKPIGIKEIPPQSTAIHNITEPGSKDIKTVFQELLNFFGNPDEMRFVAHNNNYFDELILRRALNNEIPENIVFFDTLPYLRKNMPGKKSYRLGDLYENLYNKPLENAHDARADVYALAKIFNDYIKIEDKEASPKRRRIEEITKDVLTSIRFIGDYRARLIIENTSLDTVTKFKSHWANKDAKELDHFLFHIVRIKDVTQRRFVVAETLGLTVWDDNIMSQNMHSIHDDIEYYVLFRYYPNLVNDKTKNLKRYNRGLFLLKNIKSN